VPVQVTRTSVLLSAVAATPVGAAGTVVTVRVSDGADVLFFRTALTAYT
jgi:hypothetical protein